MCVPVSASRAVVPISMASSVREYEGLKKGQKYKLTGTLMDKKTGEPILVDEKPVISETEFTESQRCSARV